MYVVYETRVCKYINMSKEKNEKFESYETDSRKAYHNYLKDKFQELLNKL